MKVKFWAGILLTAMTISACDDNTQDIGASLTKDVDHFSIIADTFRVSTRSIVIDSVLSRSTYDYLGRMKDPETGDYVTADYVTQFVQLEQISNNMFPTENTIVGRIDGQAIADSCHLNIYIQAHVGDSLAPMKLTAYEMATPLEEGKVYYSDFDPFERGLIREDGIKKQKSYTCVNYLISESRRNESSYIPYINVTMNEPYTDKNGVTYNNYGSYLMRSYYNHPEYFKKTYSFVHNVCPGFFIKTTDGAGIMSQVYTTELVVYFRYNRNDSVISANRVFTGTEEVARTTSITIDKKHIQELANDNSCTYIKSPAGLFTEVTLPVESIMKGHENDTIVQSKITFNRYIEKDDENNDAPKYLLLIPKAKLYSFFETKTIPDNITSFVCSLNGTQYTFNNISTLVTSLYKNRIAGDEDWNKVVLVPIDYTYNSSTYEVTNIANQMTLSSAKLVGGSGNTHAPVTISVIYNKGN